MGLGIDDRVWDASTFSKNRDRLLAGDVAARFLAQLLDRAEVRRLLSGEHVSVDGTLIQAWASTKSFRAKGGGGDEPLTGGRNGSRDFGGQRRRNDPRGPRPPIPMRSSTAKARAWRRACASPDTS